MNEFERKLAEQTFRPPPADLRATLFDALSPRVDSEPVARWKWWDWFWPSPLAWGALAALWLLFAAIQWAGFGSTLTPPAAVADQRAADFTLLAFHTPRELHHALDSFQ